MIKSLIYTTLFFAIISITGFSKSLDRRIAGIDRQVQEINKLSFDTLRYPPNDLLIYDESITGISGEGVSVAIYRDIKSRRPLKATVTEISGTGESGFFHTYYFNLKGEVILLLANDWVYDLSLTDTPFWKIYFSKGKVIHNISGILHNNKGRVEVLKSKALPNYMKSPEEISYYIQKLCDEQIKSLKAEAKKTQDKKNISIYNKGIALYNMTRKQWINRQYKGKYRFIAPIKGFQAMINDKIVILRAGPTTKSPPVMTLYVGQKVRIKAVGKKVTLGHLGTHHWYQVTYFPNIFSDKKIVGWVFGVYLEPVLTEVK